MRTVCRYKVQSDPASRPGQPLLDQFRTIVSGIVQKDMDQPFAWIHCLDRHQQHDPPVKPGDPRRVDDQHIQHACPASFKLDRPVDVQTLPSARLRDRDGHVFRRPTAHQPHRVTALGRSPRNSSRHPAEPGRWHDAPADALPTRLGPVQSGLGAIRCPGRIMDQAESPATRLARGFLGFPQSQGIPPLGGRRLLAEYPCTKAQPQRQTIRLDQA